MTGIADGSVIIHTSAESVPSLPCWFREIVLLGHTFVSTVSSRRSAKGCALPDGASDTLT